MCLADGLPDLDATLPERLAARRARRRIQPLTWIFTVALLPVLLYDVWQTVQDVKQHRVARAYDAAMNLGARASARPDGLPD
jgi:hypothetical protein